MSRRGVGYAKAEHLELRSRSRSYRFELTADEVRTILAELEKHERERRPEWLTLACPNVPIDGSTARLTFTTDDPPAYERELEGEYLRGSVLRVHVGESSGNIAVSPDGARLTADLLRSAQQRMGRYVLVEALAPAGRRKDHVLRVRADTDLVPLPTDRAAAEHERLAIGAEREVEHVWPVEDFSDWEDTDGPR